MRCWIQDSRTIQLNSSYIMCLVSCIKYRFIALAFYRLVVEYERRIHERGDQAIARKYAEECVMTVWRSHCKGRENRRQRMESGDIDQWSYRAWRSGRYPCRLQKSMNFRSARLWNLYVMRAMSDVLRSDFASKAQKDVLCKHRKRCCWYRIRW